MKLIAVKNLEIELHRPDVERIVEAFASEGYAIMERQAVELWKVFSARERSKEWADVPMGVDDAMIVKLLRPYFEEV